MRKRIWIFCIIIFAACLILLLFSSRQRKNLAANAPPPESVPPTQTNRIDQSKETNVAENHPRTNLPAKTSVILPQTATPLARAIAETNPVAAQVLANWQTPINFYGKVIDQSNNPVSGAIVACHWVEIPAEDGNRTTNLVTDAEGLFSLEGQRGPDLTFSISKEGYYPTQGAARYGPFGNPDFSPDPRSPITFTLRKKGKGESLIQTAFPPGMQIAQLRRDGTPMGLDLLTGEKAAAGTGNLRLQLWKNAAQGNANRFDWKVQVSSEGGGLIQTDDKFAFEAPLEGYQPSIVIDMAATNQYWREDITSRYYVRLPNGNYGRIDLYVLGYNGVFTVHSAINPSGSRNLEPTN